MARLENALKLPGKWDQRGGQKRGNRAGHKVADIVQCGPYWRKAVVGVPDRVEADLAHGSDHLGMAARSRIGAGGDGRALAGSVRELNHPPRILRAPAFGRTRTERSSWNRAKCQQRDAVM